MELHPLTGHDAGPDDPSRAGATASRPGLADRSALELRLLGAVSGMRPVGSDRSVGLVRIDGPEDRGGEVVDRLRAAVRPGDTLADLGAGTFVVLCDRLGDPDHLLTIAHRVEEQLAVPPALDPRIDVAMVGPSGRGSTALLGPEVPGLDPADPDDLPYGAWIRFDDPLRARATRRELTEAALRRTSDGRDLLLHYQPERDLTTGRISGVEALVRWTRDGAVVGPDEFVPLAERTGLIVPIGEWVLRTACEQRRRWRVDGAAEGSFVAVNVSPRQLLHDGFVGVVADVLTDTGLRPGDLVLELTEGALLGDLELAGDRLAELRALGARVAVDDFGTGYASLTYLHRLPIDAVKLDRSFVSGLGTDPRLTAIVTSVLGLLKALGLQSVAEGVSSVEQAERLRTLGCTLAQGAWVGAPAPPEVVVELLR